MSSTILLKALGLNTSPNALDITEGSLTTATNVIIKRDNVIESRRGFKLYGTGFGIEGDIAKQLFKYKTRILVHYGTKIAFDDGDGVFTDFAGSYSEVVPGLRMRGAEANGNFYFTTSDGIKKISGDSPSDFTSAAGFITDAGGIKAVDFTASLKIEQGNQSGFLAQDSAVAYRHLWNTIDLNDNLIQGTPSQRVEVYNPITNLLIPDFMQVLSALDSINQGASFITDGNYVSTLGLPIGASASTLRTNLIALAAKIDTDILYANDSGTGAPLNISGVVLSGTVATVTCSAGAPSTYFSVGSKIFLAGFSGATPPINGAQVVTFADATTFTFSTASTGVVVHASGTVVDNEYRSITQPGIPSSPSTNAELVAIQDYLDLIITQLQTEDNDIIPTALAAAYIDPLDITTTATVLIRITLPEEVTTNYFYQVYRSSQVSATGTDVLSDLVPNDELQLVYEKYLTAADIVAGFVEFEDIVTDAFRGANLYTNNTTGEGILQANDIPPLARDIANFKGSTFYANTKTRQRMNFSLLGVANMLADFDIGDIPTLVITDGTTTNTYTFVEGVAETTTLLCVSGAVLVTAAAPGSYFRMYSANDATEYYFWYKGGSATDPAPAPATNTTNVGVPILFLAGDTDAQVATKTRDTINTVVRDFTASVSTNTVTVVNVNVGITTDASEGTVSAPFAATTTIQGNGESVLLKQILLSTNASPAAAVDETARSIVRVINQNDGESIYAFYLSGASDVPGRMFLEARSLNTAQFYLLGNNANTGGSFNPDISPTHIISSNSIANPTLVTTSTSHGLVDGDSVVIVDSNSTPSINGLYAITYVSPTTFTIPVNVTVAGTSGALINTADAQFSENDEKQNRVYYSKPQQPEAVPLLNYLDIGSEDQAILRIFTLRNSLFVFKEDGLYRISGESIPFSVELFDGTLILIAPDSLDASNNNIYCWTEWGIAEVSESAVVNVSRAIDVDILRLATSQFTNFRTATWGVGYDSDNAYLVWTVVDTDDTVARICYRYSTLTKGWTIWDKTNTCGVVNPTDDKLYIGAGDTNYVEQERKDFTRLDYADRELDKVLTVGNYQDSGLTFEFIDVADVDEGDVLAQEQYLTIHQFNALLMKLDIDPGVNDTTYLSLLQAEGGDDLRASIEAVATKLDADLGVSDTDYFDTIDTKSGTITSNTALSTTVILTSAPHELETGRIVTITGSNSVPSINGTHVVTVTDATHFTIPVTVVTPGTAGTFSTEDDDFRDMQACFNAITDKLNLDATVSFSNYPLSTGTTTHEAIVTEVHAPSNQIAVNLALPFILGAMVIYKAIPTTFVYAPIHMGDPLGSKHLRNASMMFQNKAFTSAIMSFSSDLLPEFIPVPFNGDGNGIFGYAPFGDDFFGGGSHQAPFVTYVPRQCQRCRFLMIKFEHFIAREQYAVYGCTITGRVGLSSRAYR